MYTTTRYPDWPERLSDFIESRRHQKFKWGTQDCSMFACDSVLAITGTDIAIEQRGTYYTASGALRIIKDAGGLRNLVKLPEKHPGLAQRGDLVLVDQDGRELLGICLGDTYASAGADGLVFRPMAEAIIAWVV